ncbi:hypothetical protein AAFF_G00055750 [Aldrovandia affinis]|uniref:Uncharacterized protein n=1 Tax=Aldrovandia affinis TaxID=143900 RepID=A0AAD7S341_9TELE|nr:hypothetical protein AAFF_G00055750 [Aldrovandia affinis]
MINKGQAIPRFPLIAYRECPSESHGGRTSRGETFLRSREAPSPPGKGGGASSLWGGCAERRASLPLQRTVREEDAGSRGGRRTGKAEGRGERLGAAAVPSAARERTAMTPSPTPCEGKSTPQTCQLNHSYTSSGHSSGLALSPWLKQAADGGRAFLTLSISMLSQGAPALTLSGERKSASLLSLSPTAAKSRALVLEERAGLCAAAVGKIPAAQKIYRHNAKKRYGFLKERQLIPVDTEQKPRVGLCVSDHSSSVEQQCQSFDLLRIQHLQSSARLTTFDTLPTPSFAVDRKGIFIQPRL